MVRYGLYLAVVVLLFSLVSSPVKAEDEESTGVNCATFGLGADWGGLGFNYIAVPEDSPVGFSLGIGCVGPGAGASAFIITRLGGDNDALFTGAGGATWGWIGAGAVFVEYGNLPVDNGDFMWRVGIGFSGSSDSEVFPVAGFGVSL